MLLISSVQLEFRFPKVETISSSLSVFPQALALTWESLCKCSLFLYWFLYIFYQSKVHLGHAKQKAGCTQHQNTCESIRLSLRMVPRYQGWVLGQFIQVSPTCIILPSSANSVYALFFNNFKTKCVRLCSKHFTYIKLLILYTKVLLLVPFYKWENCGSE